MPEPHESEGSLKELSDALVFAVAAKWITAQGDDQKKLTSNVAQWLVKEHARELPWIDLRCNVKRQVDLTRYRVYKIVREAVDRKFIELIPPQAEAHVDQLHDKYGLSRHRHKIRVVNVTEDVVNDMVARATAETTLKLIRELMAKNAAAAEAAGKKASDAEPIGIGLGAGHSTLAVISYLAKLLKTLPSYPKLRLHALTPTIQNPMVSPVTFFRHFDVPGHIDFVDLPTAATVPIDEYERLKTQDETIERAFALRDKVQICITSLSWSGDRHGLMQRYRQYHKKKPTGLEKLEILGDLQYLPYTAEGPCLLSPEAFAARKQLPKGERYWRAVTLFDWPDFLDYHGPEAADETMEPQRHLVLCAAPCRRCGRSKWKAIAPLLRTMKFWTHLVTDDLTAQELIAEDDLRPAPEHDVD